jgi:ferrous iron transport protein A
MPIFSHTLRLTSLRFGFMLAFAGIKLKLIFIFVKQGILMSLLDAARNQFYRIKQLEGPADECRRLLDLGLTPGEEMAVVQSVPFGDPLVVVVRGMRLALRRREAAWIRVE